jgi:hypothetical protein
VRALIVALGFMFLVVFALSRCSGRAERHVVAGVWAPGAISGQEGLERKLDQMVCMPACDSHRSETALRVVTEDADYKCFCGFMK